jgi:hypothetical protein
MDVFYSMTFWMDPNSLLVACKQLEFKLWAFAMDLEASFTMKSDECFVGLLMVLANFKVVVRGRHMSSHQKTKNGLFNTVPHPDDSNNPRFRNGIGNERICGSKHIFIPSR